MSVSATDTPAENLRKVLRDVAHLQRRLVWAREADLLERLVDFKEAAAVRYRELSLE